MALTPLSARAPRGQRALDSVPRHRGTNTTLLAGLSLAGLQTPLILQGAVATDVFERDVAEMLAPTLSPGSVVVLDHWRVHTSTRARQTREARGCQMLFLPASSPDLPPSEEACSTVKAFWRRVGARTREALTAAIAAGLATSTSQDAHGWFGHCGSPARAASS